MRKLLLLFSLLSLFGIASMRADVVKSYDFTYANDYPVLPEGWECFTPMGNNNKPLSPKDCFFYVVNSVDPSVTGLRFSRYDVGVTSEEFEDVKSVKIYGWGSHKNTSWYSSFLDVYYSTDNGENWVKFGMPREDVSFVETATKKPQPGCAYLMPDGFYPDGNAPVQEITFDVPEDVKDQPIRIKIERYGSNCNTVLSKVGVEFGGDDPVVPELSPAGLNWLDAFTDEPVNDTTIEVNLGEDSYNLPYAQNASGAKITITSSNPDVATYSTVTYSFRVKAAGTTVFTATCPEIEGYEAGEASFTLVVKEESVELLPADLKWVDANNADVKEVTVTLGDEPYVLPTIVKATDADVNVTSSNPAVAEWVNGAIVVKAAGITTFTAVAAANDTYEEGEAYFTLTVEEKADLMPAGLEWLDAFTDQPVSGTIEVNLGEDNYYLPYAQNASGAKITITSSNPDVATYSTVTYAYKVKAVGTTVFTATCPEIDGYAAGEASFTLVVKDPATVELLPADLKWVDANNEVVKDVTVTLGDDPYALPTLTKATDATITVNSSNPDVAEWVDGAIVVKAVGSTTLTAVAAANETYEEGEAYFILTVEEKVGLMPAGLEWLDAFTDQPVSGTIEVYLGEESYQLPYVQNTSGAKITIVSSNPDVATFSTSTYQYNVKAVGTTVFTATCPEIDGYAAGEASFTLVVKEQETPIELLPAELKWMLNDEEVTETVNVVFGEEVALPVVAKATDADVVVVSSDESVATYDAAEGVIVVVGAGTAEFTATVAATDVYKEGEAKFTLVVAAKQLAIPAIEQNDENVVITRPGEAGKLTYYYGPVADPSTLEESDWTVTEDANVALELLDGTNYVHAYTAAPDANYIDSEVVTEIVSNSGVNVVALEGVVKVVNGTIIVPEDAQIFTVAGVRVNGKNASAGLYVVRFANGATAKVMVK